MTADGKDTGPGARSRREQLLGVAFGDRLGLALFLGALVSFAAWWRVGFFITDSTTVANTLANVADGRLAVVETPYSLTLGSQPGLHRVGDQLFGRNYGHALLALPVVWALDALGAVADPRLLLAGAWSLLLVALSGQVAALTGRERVGTLGSALALVVFAGNVATATSLSEGQFPWEATTSALPGAPHELLALQVTTMLAAAVVSVTTYRLLARFHGRRAGAAAGMAVVLATPLSFWASIPKRHVLTAAAVTVALYCFAVSRAETDRRGRWARAGSYAALGALTTVHAFEAFFLLVVLLPVDLLTAPSNGRRTLGLVGTVFFLSLVPFLVVNTLISGNPLQPPRTLSGVGLNPDVSPGPDPSGGSDPGGTGGSGGDAGGTGGNGESTSGGGDTGGGQSSGDDAGGLPLEVVLAPLLRAIGYADRIVGFAVDAVLSGVTALSDPERLYHTFVRSGRIPGVSYVHNDFEAVELALLESFPLVAALVWLPVAALERMRDGVRSHLGEPVRQTDLLAAGFLVVFTVVYLPLLPLHSQITVRYILPVVPILLYGLVRLSVVRRPVEAAPRWLAGGYLATAVGGGGLMAGTLALLDPAVGEAMQFHALVGLATAVVAAVCAVTWRRHEDPRVVAVGLALPAGTTTAFLTMCSLAYFDYGSHALGLTRALADLVPVL